MTERTTEEIRRAVWQDAKAISGVKDTSSNDCLAVALLIAGAITGPSTGRCAKLLGVKYDQISWMTRNLRENKVWGRTKVYGDWIIDENATDEEVAESAVALICDSCVALGIIQRAGAGWKSR